MVRAYFPNAEFNKIRFADVSHTFSIVIISDFSQFVKRILPSSAQTV